MHPDRAPGSPSKEARRLSEIAGKRNETEAELVELARRELHRSFHPDVAGRTAIPVDNVHSWFYAAAKRRKEGPPVPGSFTVCGVRFEQEGPGEREDGHAFQGFAGAAEFASCSGAVTAAREGSAACRGAAAGACATEENSGGRATAASSDAFTAEAAPTAHFFGARDAGEIVSFGNASGRSLAGWRATLNCAPLNAGSDSFAGATGGTVGSAGGGVCTTNGAS